MDKDTLYEASIQMTNDIVTRHPELINVWKIVLASYVVKELGAGSSPALQEDKLEEMLKEFNRLYSSSELIDDKHSSEDLDSDEVEEIEEEIEEETEVPLSSDTIISVDLTDF